MLSLKKVVGFENEQFFVIPDDFREGLDKNALTNFLTTTVIGYFPRAKNHYIRRSNGCHTALMLYCSAGGGFYSINGDPANTLSPGQLIILPPNTPHEYGASENNPWTIYWVHFKGAFFQPFYEMVFPSLPVPIGDVLGDRIKEIFNQCFCLLQMPYQKEEYLYLCQLVTTMLTIIPCAAKQSIMQLSLDGSEGIEKAISYMQNHLHEEIHGGRLAEVSHFSYSHLTHLFKRSTGYAPIEFFLRTKIQAAARALYFSNLPVKDIALSYGIEDAYYFSRLFKKIMGVSPSEYRNRTTDYA
ncbi:transcriptional regulator [Spirochaetia bacterium]|nr:transcriptional regulator [Spirochaetia bacterium]